MKSPHHAKACLIFKNFKFQRKRSIQMEKKRFIVFVVIIQRNLFVNKKRNDRNYLRQHPGEKFLTDPFINPTIVNNPKSKELNIQFDFEGIDPKNPEKHCVA